MFVRIAALSLAALCTACSAGAIRGPVEVIRFNLGQPIQPGTFVLEEERSASAFDAMPGLGESVAAGLGAQGFSRVPSGGSQYVLRVSHRRGSGGTVNTGSPVQIGLGGGSFGRGGGVGGGLGIPLGGSSRELVNTEITAKIERRIDNTVVWEGSARNQSTAPRTPEEAAALSERMAAALFRDFPGQSGFTTTVP
ncbi:DUF4136 domain-containing protein [Sphingomonas sp.]